MTIGDSFLTGVGQRSLKTLQIYVRMAGVGIKGITDSLDLHNPSSDLADYDFWKAMSVPEKSDASSENSGFKKTIKVQLSATFGAKETIEILNEKRVTSYFLFKSHESSCSCELDMGVNGASSISCKIPGGYRTQLGINCDINDSKEHAAYAFMCKNIYVWCE